MKFVLSQIIPTLFTFAIMNACNTQTHYQEEQITDDLSYHHDLDNNDNFSPDGQWLVYDTRTDEGGIAASAKIERVNIRTKEKQVLFQIPNNGDWGPGAGAVSYSTQSSEVIFIHGLTHCTPENPYQQWRRTGVIIDDSRPNQPIYMDARDITPPFTVGALRGGTHRHEWSGDGQWVGYTYNDAILQALEAKTGEKHNLRTIGVSKKGNPVSVDNGLENVSGEWFSVLVVRVVPHPTPGSDEISHAASDSWIGLNGYQNNSGNKQMARAFLGTVVSKEGKPVHEVFVVDIPDDISQPGEFGPLQGTATTFPMPPKGAVQRRLTQTADAKYPGCSGIVRSSPDGSHLSYIAKDDNGILQIFLISPNGGAPIQLTEHISDVSGNVRWHPDGTRLSYIYDGSITICKIGNQPFSDRFTILTQSSQPAPSNMVWSGDGKTLAYNRLIKDRETQSQQIFILPLE
jgi:hypothetical protein